MLIVCNLKFLNSISDQFYHQHNHSHQQMDQHKPVTFYLDEELQAMNNGRSSTAGNGNGEPELVKRFINNLEANFLGQKNLLTPASAPISPCDFKSREDEPINNKKKDPRSNSTSLVEVS